MGNLDRRHSMKMRRRKGQAKKKAREHKRADARKARLTAATPKKAGKKS